MATATDRQFTSAQIIQYVRRTYGDLMAGAVAYVIDGTGEFPSHVVRSLSREMRRKQQPGEETNR